MMLLPLTRTSRILSIGAAIVVVCIFAGDVAAQDNAELRGVWLTNVDSDVMFSREGIASAMAFLKAHNFNAVFPVVWNDAKTLYPSRIMDSLFGMPLDPRMKGRDPLAEVIEEARKYDIAVIPWFEYGFAASHKKNGGMILEKFPRWAARDKNGNLLTKNGFEWMNGLHPEVQNFVLSLILEVVRTYDIDGIQGDDRLPALPIEGGYDEWTLLQYARERNGAAAPRDERDSAWTRWRADILNRFAARVYHEVKAVKPSLIVSWAPSIYPWAYWEYLQDWPAWIKNGAADLVIPQVYRYTHKEYGSALAGLSPDSTGYPRSFKYVYPGVLIKAGSYVVDADVLISTIEQNRTSGYGGEVLFFYEGLRTDSDKLANALSTTVYSTPAIVPWKTWPRPR